jgi:antitoxin MazE
MEARVARWGNSLGVRIPKEIASRAGIGEGSRVEIATENGQIVLSPARPRYRLEDLLHGMSRRAIWQAFDWGPDVGREKVDK